MAAVEFKALITDHAPHSSLSTVLKWCDTAQGAFFRSVPDKAMAEQLVEAYSFASVMRTNTVEMLLSQQDWLDHLGDAAVAVVRPVLVRIGRTSWAMQSSVETSAGVPIARVQSVMVSVDREDATRPVPVPYAEVLRGLVREAAPVQAPESGPRPPGAFVWRTEVRQSDCDNMKHINNALYASLFEDARQAAAVAGAIPGWLAGGEAGFARRAWIEYLGQPKAGDLLDIAVWWDRELGTVGGEFSVAGGVVAKAAMIPWKPMLQSSL